VKKLEDVYKYLSELGYPIAQIAPEVQVGKEGIADLVVYNSDGQPWIVVFKSLKNISALDEPHQLRFNPYVRQLQVYAHATGAPYYLLTDGQKFEWLTTDIFGRPRLLTEPVTLPKGDGINNLSFSKESILIALKNVKNLFLRQSKFLQNNTLAVIILAKFLDEQGDHQLKRALTSEGATYEHPVLLRSLDLSMETWDREYLEKALEILDSVSFSLAQPQDLISAIDEIFLSSRRNHEIRPARWLSDFLVRLSYPSSNSQILDIYSGYGDILGAALMLQKQSSPASVVAIGSDPETILWAQVQQLILGRKEGRILFQDPLNLNSMELQNIIKPTHIVTAPSFGRRLDSSKLASEIFSTGSHQIEDLLLELGVRWIEPEGRIVMLVPESLLFDAGKRKAVRKFILARTQITAVISLASGALLPFSSIKSSILVLDKKSDLEVPDVFMSHIDVLPVRDTFDSREIPELFKVLEAFKQWDEERKLTGDSIHWTIPIHDIDIDNLTVNRYKPISSANDEHPESLYPTVHIKDVARLVKRGASIRLEELGELLVIGPACIRPMILDIGSAGRTVQEKIPSNSLTVKIDDVVLNNVGTYLGAAAVVKEANGSYISQHVILIRPDSSIILSDYLAAALNSAYVKQQIEKVATGSIMPSLSLKGLDEIKIPLPNLETQQRIVSKINNEYSAFIHAKKQYLEAEKKFTNSIKYLLVEEGK
jgi:hypothetical protein